MLIELFLLGGGATLWHKLKHKKNNKTDTQASTFNSKQLFLDLKSALVGTERQEQQKSIDPENPNLQGIDKAQQQRSGNNMLLSVGAVGLAALGMVSPAFYLLGSAAVIYLGRHVYQLVWQDIKRGHIISVYLVSSLLVLGMIATGQLLYSAIAAVLSGFMVRLIKNAENNSQQRLINVFSEHPTQVWIEKEGIEIEIEFADIQLGDIVIVQAGEIIPVDGEIRHGFASIDQHILTGESQPVERGIGEKVLAATLVLAGRIHIVVETAGEETVAANIGKMLNNTKSYKNEVMLRGKKIADSMLPLELGGSLVTWALLGPLPALGVLWSGLGYRMIMFGPISVLNYLQVLSRRGILIKDGRVFESLRQVDTIVFDKTGTLTEEQPTIGVIHVLADYDENQVLQFAASAEHRQPHPLARAIIHKAKTQGLTLEVSEQASYEVGYGIKVQLQQHTVRVGSARFMQREGLPLPLEINKLQQQAEEQGHSLVYVAVDEEVAGVLEIQPSIRPEALELMQYLKQRGITTYIISGDHEQPTRNIAQKLGVDHYFAETLPENKAQRVKQLCDAGKFVCFIGDGINDAIALKSAQVSISLKGASSAATDTAQIIFMDGTLVLLKRLFEFSDEFEETMQRNVAISFAPGIVNIAGIYLLHFGLTTSMILFYGGTVVGLANSLLPLAKHQDNTTQNLKQLPPYQT
ncbi:heavy metal translocating P-type ATPase [Thioflexithrix psekupsensis]|uniref:P-type ATPase A domain-containing protein n=1 Tax=Thioflexithrix psekupsensis TaxID=1570016 RepID=A0A251X4I0_9GAMM|nr:heavy metal translocating P-type ATPase [Thioflexithrix psekupsensis]OUD12290.1 hypothetical protein TPSD3_14325 [Thioflexithrix psekupsensis]